MAFQPNTVLYGCQVRVEDEGGNIVDRGILDRITDAWTWIVGGTTYNLVDDLTATIVPDEGDIVITVEI